MAAFSPNAVAAHRIESKKDGVKEQLAVLEKADRELESVEHAVNVELNASLQKVEDHVTMLRKLGETISEAAEERVSKINGWRAKLSEASKKATEALLEAEQVLTGSDEGDFLQQYSTASKCLEDNFMCLLMLAHSFPCDAFEYPKQVRDLQLGMTPGSLKLEAVCSGVEATIGHLKDSNDDQQQFTCAQNLEESNEDLRLSEQSDVSSDAPATATASINETFDSEMAHHVGPYASVTQCSSDGEDNGVPPIAPSKSNVCGLQSELHSDCAASENVFTPHEDSLGEGFAGGGNDILTEETHSTVTESEPIDSLGEEFAGGGDNILTEETHSIVTESEAIDSLGEEFVGGDDNILTGETHSTVTESEAIDSLGEGFAGVGDNILTEETHSTVTESEPIDSLGEGFAGGGDNIFTGETHSIVTESEAVDSLGEGFAGGGNNIFTEETHSTVTESEPIDSLGEGFAGGGDNIFTGETHSIVTESEPIDSLGEGFAGGGDNIFTEETHSTVTESEPIDSLGEGFAGGGDNIFTGETHSIVTESELIDSLGEGFAGGGDNIFTEETHSIVTESEPIDSLGEGFAGGGDNIFTGETHSIVTESEAVDSLGEGFAGGGDNIFTEETHSTVTESEPIDSLGEGFAGGGDNIFTEETHSIVTESEAVDSLGEGFAGGGDNILTGETHSTLMESEAIDSLGEGFAGGGDNILTEETHSTLMESEAIAGSIYLQANAVIDCNTEINSITPIQNQMNTGEFSDGESSSNIDLKESNADTPVEEVCVTGTQVEGIDCVSETESLSIPMADVGSKPHVKARIIDVESTDATQPTSLSNAYNVQRKRAHSESSETMSKELCVRGRKAPSSTTTDEVLPSAGILMKSVPLQLTPGNANEGRDNLAESSTPLHIPHLDLRPGCDITVLIIECCGPNKFIAQPYAPYLIQLMGEMRKCYDAIPEQQSGSKLVDLKSGDYCSALFAEDQCWYRARIVDVFNQPRSTCAHPSSNQFKIYFVDYGNTTEVSAIHIRPLPKKFCQLPCQALRMAIGDSPLGHSLDYSSSGLVGTIVTVRVTAYEVPNSVEVIFPAVSDAANHCTADSVGESCTVEDTSLHLQLSPPTINIANGDSFLAVISHINSVDDFYLLQLDKVNADNLKQMEADMQLYFSNQCNHSVIDPKLIVPGAVGCMYSDSDGLYCRAIVLSVNADSNCEVQLVDYGHTQKVSLSGILKGPPEFLHYSVFSLHCRLFLKERNELSDEFIEEITCAFKELPMKVFSVTPILQGNVPSPLTSWNSSLLVELHSCVDDNDVNIAEELCKKTSPCAEVTDSGVNKQSTRDWDPMQSDYLGRRNKYSIDDEDVGSALLGYKSTNRICRFYDTQKGCFAGLNCRYLHLPKDVATSELVQSHKETSSSLILPRDGEFVMLIVTAVLSPRRFFAQMPVGPNVLMMQASEEATGVAAHQSPASHLDALLKEMSEYYNHQVFEEDCQFIFDGEVVAAHNKNNNWFRAEVLKCNKSGVLVFNVDFGDMSLVLPSDVRIMKDNFMTLPFQAIECSLSDKEASDMGSTEDFVNCVTDSILLAEVVAKCNNCLEVRLHCEHRKSERKVTKANQKYSKVNFRPG